MTLLAAFLLASAPLIPAGETFNCTPVRVWDGDGPIWCESGVRIRLAGIAAREIDGTCRQGHPCPRATGIEARDALVRFLGTPTGKASAGHITLRAHATLRCVSTGSAGGNRTGAWCHSPRTGDIACAMVRGGYAARWQRYWGDHRCG